MSKLNEDTSIPIKIIVPVILAIVSMTMWVNSTLNGIKSEIHNAWSVKSMQTWSRTLSIDNPTLKVPSPSDFTFASHTNTVLSGSLMTVTMQ